MWYYADYLANPPLGLLVMQGKYDRLAAKLENGANPNEIDLRYKQLYYPLELAFHNHRVKAAKILIDHGARFPSVVYFQGNYHSDKKTEIAVYALRSGIPQEMAHNNDAIFYINTWVNEWLQRSLIPLEYAGKKERDGSLEFEAVSLLLKSGFPVNSIRVNRQDNIPAWTALDRVLLSRRLTSEDKQRMVALLRSYNAKTYPELVEEDNSLPHLDLSGIEVEPQFQEVVEILQHSRNAIGYRVSADCPGIEGPLLVFDYLPVEAKMKGELHTKTINVHRRKANHEWNQECESVEIPEYYRIILTPKGNKVPSQIRSDEPRKMKIQEAWVTLKTCEMYVALNPERECSNLLFYDDLEAIILTIVPPSISRYAARSNFYLRGQGHDPIIDYSFFKDHFANRLDESSPIPAEVEVSLQRANRKIAELGLPGKWRVYSISPLDAAGKKLVKFVYSSTRTLEELQNTPLPIAPFPNEIMIRAYENYPHQPIDELQPRLIEHYRETDGYWNHGSFLIRSSNNSYNNADILYGDSVSMQTLQDIAQTILELFQ